MCSCSQISSCILSIQKHHFKVPDQVFRTTSSRSHGHSETLLGWRRAFQLHYTALGGCIWLGMGDQRETNIDYLTAREMYNKSFPDSHGLCYVVIPSPRAMSQVIDPGKLGLR